MLSSIIWNPDPELFSFGALTVRWYGLIYATGFFIGITLLGKMFKHDNAPDNWLDKVFIYMVLAVIIGARLGHVFFYDWEYYRENVGEIFKIWHGGLASHGGAIAMVLTCWLLSKYLTKQNIWWLGDRLVVPSALVACMIRLGNLMNSEIYGTPTDLPWGFVFLRGNEQFCGTVDNYTAFTVPFVGCPPTEWLPCHPTQLYEAFAYFALFVLMMWLYWKKDAGSFNGLLTGIGFTGVFVARQVIEFLKNDQSAFEANMTFNMGQWLSVPFVILGVYLIVHSLKKGKVVYNLPVEKPTQKKKK
ncbi:MAG: prolipoprotein diacylglyceryl transferase [Bacteroidota bacterium]|nr:prolipoprotein diacylglyceryl transferase [Bacteroidota bacterium]